MHSSKSTDTYKEEGDKIFVPPFLLIRANFE